MIQLSAEAIIKQQARAALKHNHVRAIIALIITLIPLYMIDGTTTVISCAVAKAVPDNETMQGILVYGLGYTAEFVIGFMLSPVTTLRTEDMQRRSVLISALSSGCSCRCFCCICR